MHMQLIIAYTIYLCHLFQQLFGIVAMGPFDWLMGDLLMKAEWRSASMECGGQCATLVGVVVMPELYADNWVTVSVQVALN